MARPESSVPTPVSGPRRSHVAPPPAADRNSGLPPPAGTVTATPRRWPAEIGRAPPAPSHTVVVRGPAGTRTGSSRSVVTMSALPARTCTRYVAAGPSVRSRTRVTSPVCGAAALDATPARRALVTYALCAPGVVLHPCAAARPRSAPKVVVAADAAAGLTANAARVAARYVRNRTRSPPGRDTAPAPADPPPRGRGAARAGNRRTAARCARRDRQFSQTRRTAHTPLSGAPRRPPSRRRGQRPFSTSALRRSSDASASRRGSPPTIARLAMAPSGPSGARDSLP